MASFHKLKNGVFAVDIYGFGRIRLGKTKSIASFDYAMLERLEASRKSGRDPDLKVRSWLRQWRSRRDH